MMDKCPQCSYEPAPIWKNRRFHTYQKYVKMDELRTWEPELAAIIEAHGQAKQTEPHRVTYSDGYYNFMFREDGTVVRIAKKFCRSPDTMREPGKATHHHKRG